MSLSRLSNNRSPMRFISVRMLLYTAFFVAYVTILAPYITIPEASTATQLLAALQWFIPSVFLLVLKYKFPVIPNYLVIAAITGSIGLQLLHVPGLWWSWSTMALAVITFYTAGKGWRGLAATILAIATWEVIYQIGILLYYDFFGSGVNNFIVVLCELMMWVIPAMIILIYYRLRPHFHVSTKICLVGFLGCLIIWLACGMHIPLVWFEGNGPYETGANSSLISVSRGCQAFCYLGVASCLKP